MEVELLQAKAQDIDRLQSEIKQLEAQKASIQPAERFQSGTETVQRVIHHKDLGIPCFSARCSDPLKIVRIDTVQVPVFSMRFSEAQKQQIRELEIQIEQKKAELENKKRDLDEGIKMAIAKNENNIRQQEIFEQQRKQQTASARTKTLLLLAGAYLLS